MGKIPDCDRTGPLMELARAIADLCDPLGEQTAHKLIKAIARCAMFECSVRWLDRNKVREAGK